MADGPEGVTHAVRYQIKHGAKVIKLCATAGVLSFEGSVGAQQMDDEEMRAAVREAARHGMSVTAHAHGSEGILAAVRAGVTSIEHGSILTPQVLARDEGPGHLADARRSTCARRSGATSCRRRSGPRWTRSLRSWTRASGWRSGPG